VSRSLAWYARRLRQMSPEEVAWRAVDRSRQASWARRQVRPGDPVLAPAGLTDPRVFATPLPRDARSEVPAAARTALLDAAERLLGGDWELLGTPRTDIAEPDWFADPVTGRRSPADRLAFRIDHRDEQLTGNVKSVWELSRHHHLTVLAAAWWLTHDERYAEAVDRQLRSWWSANPFLSGIHWTSGIELGVRLLGWVWIRRLLEDWPKVTDLFEANPTALAQIRWHQQYLATFRSRGSSANNHEVLEAAGRVAAACAFPWFAESEEWRRDAVAQFEATVAANTFQSGVNRELATDYHRFVAETAVLVGAEASAAGSPLSDRTWGLIVASLDAAAAVLDESGRAPRQGDGDEGRALVLDDPDREPWALLLDLGRQAAGARPWWPQSEGSVLGTLVGALTRGPRSADERAATRPSVFPDAGVTILRTEAGDGPEIWCRCDGGPHGFLSIAAHAHADALSVELRSGGVDIFVDPGTYCYHGEPEWRTYFRSTRAHNTVEVDGRSQSLEGGPFLWSTRAATVVDQVEVGSSSTRAWTAHHDGYADLEGPVGHRRTVELDADARVLRITDRVSGFGQHDLAVRFHLGPDVDADLRGDTVHLGWSGPHGPQAALLELPGGLTWSAHRGEVDPPLGWYSPRFGQRVPITTLVGRGDVDLDLHSVVVLDTVIAFQSTRGSAR
jgi:hypothetical protein